MFYSSIEIKDVTKTLGERNLLDGVSFTVPGSETVGLVGLNGCGKSTLFKIITGIESPDFGVVKRIPANLKIGYLPQWIDPGELTVGDFIESAAHEAKIEEDWQKSLAIDSALDEVGLPGFPLNTSLKIISGGERTRIYIASLLIARPDCLLLDEPTNFLDIKGLAWMERFIKSFPGGVLLVSHDRYFLDRLVDRIVEIEYGALYEYSGNYTFYRQAKEARIEKQLGEFRSQQDEIRRLKALAQRQRQFGGKVEKETTNDYVRARGSKHSKTAKAIEKRIERMEPANKPKRNYLANVRFEGGTSSRIVAKVENLTKSFGSRILYKNVNFTIQAGERVGIIGDNGSGKTTLLNLIRGAAQPDSGSAYLLPCEKVGFFSQIFDDLGGDRTVLDTMIAESGLDAAESRQILAYFLFRRDDVFKKIKHLSIGERSRLVLAIIKGKEPEALILDEPTSHLDVDTTEILERALGEYKGTIIVVTHDRYLLDGLVERLISIEEQEVRDYPGNYSYYLQRAEA